MRSAKRYKGYTLAEAEQELEAWKEARRAAATGKQYQLGSQMLTRYELPQIEEQIEEFAAIVDVLSGDAPGGIALIPARMVRR